MKRRIWLLLAVFAAASLLVTFATSCGGENISYYLVRDTRYDINHPFVASSVFEITSPYEDVDWSTYGHFKAALHAHTTNSDGSASMLQAVERHYELDYDILAITDHVWRGSEGSRPFLDLVTSAWTQAVWTTSNNNFGASRTTELTHITQAQLDAIQAGTHEIAPVIFEGNWTQRLRGKSTGLLMIPHTAEFALEVGGEEMNVFFFEGNAPPAWSTNLRGGIYAANKAGAVFFINHPGRTTNAMNWPVADNVVYAPNADDAAANIADPNNPSNMDRWVRKYADLYMAFPRTTLVGMEVFNRNDRDSRQDRVLWDNVLSRTMREGRTVWGYANDDSHSVGGVGINTNIMVMPSLTTDNFKTAMIKGQSYMVTAIARNEGVNAGAGSSDGAGVMLNFSERPAVTSVTVNHANDTITINAANADRIVWISEGRIISTTDSNTSTIDLKSFGANEVGIYVRANIIGEHGMAAIQPIGTRRK
jgi:hypothetical protein